MSNTYKRESLQKVRIKYRNVKAKRDAYIDRRNVINAELNTAWHKYLQIQAKGLTGDENKKQLTKAESVYLCLKNELADLDKKIEISERLLSIWSEKMATARADNVKDSIQYNRDKLKPYLSKIEKSNIYKALDVIKQRLRGLMELIAVFGSIYLLIAIIVLYPDISTFVILAIILSFFYYLYSLNED